jgi:hypothetical protein
MTIELNIADFRAQFPQFADTTKYPDSTLQLQFDIATSYVTADTYGDMTTPVRTHAIYLMMAHLLQLNIIIAQNAANGGGQIGVVQSATIGSVSVTLQPPPVRGQWRWWLNNTPYGAQLVALLEMQSAGGFFVGGLPERAAFRKVGGVF